MKKIFSYAMMLLATTVALTSCEDDRDSNPELLTPTAFVVNNPAVGGAMVDLVGSNAVNLTWSQPVFTTMNAPVVANYEVLLSPSGKFTKQYDEAAEDNTGADFFALAETYTECNALVPTADIDKALELLEGWQAEADVPADMNISIRVRAFVQDATQVVRSEILSNVVTIKTIPYYIELKNADPELWYLIGGDICDGSWGGDIGKQILPLQTIDGYEYDAKTGQGEITWTGYLAGNGFKLKQYPDSWDFQWGQGDAFGSYLKNDGGSGNITVPAAGYYTITLNTAKDELSIEAADITPAVFASICVSGDFNEWGDTEMSPCFTFDGAVNHDWYTTVELDGTQGIKFKELGSWDYNTGGPVAVTSTGDLYGYGTNGGDNIYPEAGTYLVIYNDITRAYRFIKK